MLNKIKKYIDFSTDHFAQLFFTITPQPLFIKAIKKYPNHRYLIYAIWQIKGVSLFLMICFLVWYVTHELNGQILCKEYIDMFNSQINISDLT